jgi:glycosyltransferase involved in cell wall biosynthesis
MKHNYLPNGIDSSGSALLRIGIDISPFDCIGFGGQYRYAVSLILGLSEIKQDYFSFIVFGSNCDPVSEIADIFVTKSKQWSYRKISAWGFKGGAYLNYLRYITLTYYYRINLWHMLHTFIPVLVPCPIVVTEYDLMYELFDEYKQAVNSRPHQIHKFLVRKRVKQVIAISHSTADDLRQLWNIPSDKITVVQLACEFFGLSELTHYSDFQKILELNSPTILSPFNLEPRKNLKSLLIAFQLVQKHSPDLRLILYGKAAWTTERNCEFQTLIHELGIEDSVILTGYLEDSDLVAFYRHTTLFVFPSLYEGFGLPVLEAMASGACVLACKSSSISEVVGEGGLLLDTSNIDELTSGISTLLSNSLLRQNLSKLAVMISRKFSVSAMATKTFQVYQKCLKIPLDSVN